MQLNCLPISRGCNYRSQKMKILQFGFSALQPSEATYLKMEVDWGHGNWVERGGAPWSSVVRLSCKSVERAWTWQVNADSQQSALREASSSRKVLFCVLKLRSECSQATQKNSCTTSLARISCLSQSSSFCGCILFRIGLAKPHWREAAWCAFSGHPLTFELIHENFHV